MLNNIENKFNNLSKKTILELFLILIILFVLIIVFIKEDKKKIDIDLGVVEYREDIHAVYNKIKAIEDLKIISSMVDKKNINISTKSTMQHLVFIINSIENINDYIKISDINISKEEKKLYKMNFIVKLSIYKERNKKYLVEYKKPIHTIVLEDNIQKINKSNISEQNNQKEESFKLNAIVFNSIILNGKYLKLDEKIYDYKIIEIRHKSVKLSNNQNTMEIFLDGR